MDTENPCKLVSASADVYVERDHCFCPGHGVYEAPHTRCLGGAITIVDGKAYRSGLCDGCNADPWDNVGVPEDFS